jgi:hypothetical protein
MICLRDSFYETLLREVRNTLQTIQSIQLATSFISAPAGSLFNIRYADEALVAQFMAPSTSNREAAGGNALRSLGSTNRRPLFMGSDG